MAVVEFVRVISGYLHPSLAVDSELIENIRNHLTCMMLNIDQHNFLDENSLLEEIKDNYINIFSTINLHKNILTGFLRIDIPAIDLGYLTIYTAAAMERLFIQMTKKKVVVLCNKDQSLACLMISRLYAEIQGLDIRVVSSILELTRVIQTTQHDLIITTIPFEISGQPIVVVNPIMKDTDLLNIRKILGIQTNKELSTHYKDKIHLVDLLTTKTITLQASAENWMEAVDCSCARFKIWLYKFRVFGIDKKNHHIARTNYGAVARGDTITCQSTGWSKAVVYESYNFYQAGIFWP